MMWLAAMHRQHSKDAKLQTHGSVGLIAQHDTKIRPMKHMVWFCMPGFVRKLQQQQLMAVHPTDDGIAKIVKAKEG